MADVDLLTHFGLSDAGRVELNDENFPPGTSFVTGSSNRLMRVERWVERPGGRPAVYLLQGAPGVASLEGLGDEALRRFDGDNPQRVYRIASPGPTPAEETPPAEAPAGLDDEDFGEDLVAPPPASEEETAAEEPDLEEVSSESEAALDESDDDEADDDDDADEEGEDEQTGGGDDPEDITHPSRPSDKSDLNLKTEWDGKPDSKSKTSAILACAAIGDPETGGPVTVDQVIKHCMGHGLYTEINAARSGVVRTIKKARTQGYGLLFDEEADTVALTRDGVTRYLPPETVVAPDTRTQADLLAQEVRSNLGMSEVSDLPRPLAAALASLKSDECDLSPKQVRAIVHLAYGISLLISGT